MFGDVVVQKRSTGIWISTRMAILHIKKKLPVLEYIDRGYIVIFYQPIDELYIQPLLPPDARTILLLKSNNCRAYTPAIYRANDHAYTPTINQPTDRQALSSILNYYHYRRWYRTTT